MNKKIAPKQKTTVNYLDKVFDAWHFCDNAYLKLVRQWGISLNTVWVLEYLDKHPEGAEPAVLADETHMLRQAITVVLNDLEGRGYLSRAANADDRRRKNIQLTPEGTAFAKKVLAAISAAEQDAAAALSTEELRRLCEYSQRFSREFTRCVNEIILCKNEPETMK